MEDSLISVIVPVYNAERFLAACLDSILSQSYRNIEVIVIDDGSTDFSLSIAQKYSEKDDRIKVYNFTNQGLAEARNHGLDVATGSLITFVDSDDLLLPDALEVLISIMFQLDVSIVEGAFRKAEILDKIKTSRKFKTQVYLPYEAIEKVLYQSEMLPSICGKLYKRNLFESIKFQKGLLYEDLDIFYKIFERASKIAYINFPVYFYRTNDESITHVWKKERLDVLKVTENIVNYFINRNPALLPAASDRRLSANFNMFALCALNGEYDMADKCWNHIKQNRKKSLFNSKVRFKNKAGVLLSYCGKKLFNLAARKIYR